MKRPFPTATVASTLLLALSSISITQAQDEVETRKKPEHFYDEEQCPSLLARATKHDADNSGGLSKSEFASLWSDLGGVAGSTAEGSSVFLPESVSDAYSHILCQCHYTFDLPEQCCDDTNTDDAVPEESSEGEGGKKDDEEETVWIEIKMVGFDDDKPNKNERHYIKQFCGGIQHAMHEEGLELATTTTAATEAEATTIAAATTAAATTAAATTTAATTTTEEVTTEATTTEATEATSTEAPETTTDAPEEIVATTASTVADIVDWNTNATEASSASSSTTVAPPVTTTAATTTSTVTTTTSTEAEVTTTPLATTTAPEILDPITLRFVGSTGGLKDADAYDDYMDGVTHAFWRVALDVLGYVIFKEQGRRTEEEWDFSQKAAVYFESAKMYVDDVDCPNELAYAREDDPCLEFSYILEPRQDGPLTADNIVEFVDYFEEAANEDGELYDTLVEQYPTTPIVGMGSPGGGVKLSETDANTNANNQMMQLNSEGSKETKDVQASGFPVGGMVGIILAALVVALIVVAMVVKRRRSRKRHRELNDSNLSEDLEANEVNDDAANVEEWLDEEHDEEDPAHGGGRGGTNPNSPASSLAAMGVASTVATRLTTGDTEVMVTEKQAWSKVEPVI